MARRREPCTRRSPDQISKAFVARLYRSDALHNNCSIRLSTRLIFFHPSRLVNSAHYKHSSTRLKESLTTINQVRYVHPQCACVYRCVCVCMCLSTVRQIFPSLMLVVFFSSLLDYLELSVAIHSNVNTYLRDILLQQSKASSTSSRYVDWYPF